MSQADAVVTSVPPRSATVLIVEDDPQMSALLRDVMTGEGYRVDVARTGDRAGARLAEGEYDVILCDLVLPGLAGPRLYRRLVGSRPDLAERFVFFAGYGGEEAEALLGFATAPVLRTPFRIDDLLKIVEDVRRPA